MLAAAAGWYALASAAAGAGVLMLVGAAGWAHSLQRQRQLVLIHRAFPAGLTGVGFGELEQGLLLPGRSRDDIAGQSAPLELVPGQDGDVALGGGGGVPLLALGV